MEEICVNFEYGKSVGSATSQNESGPRSSQRRFDGAVVLSLGLLSVGLLAGLIGLGVHYHDSMSCSAADFSIIIDNLTQHLQASHDQLSTVLEERDLLNASLTETRKELHSLCTQKRTCPTGWTLFMFSCYHLSTKSGSWTTGREDCRTSGANLVVIDSTEEQKFLSSLVETNVWIGLTDRDSEGTWMWIDGTALTLRYWEANQPDNAVGSWGDEDCVHLQIAKKTEQNWNDLPCDASQRWICEKSIDC